MKYFIILIVISLANCVISKDILFKLSARNLPSKDKFGGKSDPYAVVRIGVKEIGKTEVISNNNDPKWEEDFALKYFSQDCLTIQVYDADGLDEDDDIGFTHVCLRDINSLGEKVVDITRDGAKKGELIMEVIEIKETDPDTDFIDNPASWGLTKPDEPEDILSTEIDDDWPPFKKALYREKKRLLGKKLATKSLRLTVKDTLYI